VTATGRRKALDAAAQPSRELWSRKNGKEGGHRPGEPLTSRLRAGDVARMRRRDFDIEVVDTDRSRLPG